MRKCGNAENEEIRFFLIEETNLSRRRNGFLPGKERRGRGARKCCKVFLLMLRTREELRTFAKEIED